MLTFESCFCHFCLFPDQFLLRVRFQRVRYVFLFQVAQEYLKNYQLLLVGVICLATSVNKWGLNRRIALRLVTMLGVNPAW